MYRWLRPLLFKLPPETAHSLSVRALSLAGCSPTRPILRRLFQPSSSPVTAFGLHFKNTIGLAAGYDKSAQAWRGLEALGFGHIELGTVTPQPQPGNPRPRVFRIVEEEAVINRLGFPNDGARVVAHRLRKARASLAEQECILGINIGKQKSTPLVEAAGDYTSLIHAFGPLADYLAVNISSPNTPGLRELQLRNHLESLLKAVAAERDLTAANMDRHLPVLVKLSPDMSPDALATAVGVIEDTGMDGIIATNTTITRPTITPSHRPMHGPTGRAAEDPGAGGLSGKPLADLALRVTREIRRLTDLPIVGVGGIMTADDAARRLDAGATLLQVYTGLIYRGPSLVKDLMNELARS